RLDAHAEARPSFGMRVEAALGAQFLLWEYTTALLGRLLGVNPFDKRDVESAKTAARTVLASAASERDATRPALSTRSVIERLSTELRPGGYIAIQAYLGPGLDEQLLRLRELLARRFGAPVSVGYGPR